MKQTNFLKGTFSIAYPPLFPLPPPFSGSGLKCVVYTRVPMGDEPPLFRLPGGGGGGR